MTDEFAIKILEQYREKPTLINEIETVEEAVWLDEALDMAIKALEQESASTQEYGLIDVVDDNNIKKVIKLIQDYPEWIDITEKLPPEGKEILVCDIDGDIYLTHRIAESEHSSRYYDSDGNKIKSITAWQPLPKPYEVIN